MTRNPEYTYLTDSKGRTAAYIKIECAHCGKEAMSRVNQGAAVGRFCSHACAVALRHARGLMPRPPSGPEHADWKGSAASYSAMHKRVRRARGPADHCEQREQAGCKSIKYNWAHIHGTDPGDPANYRQLCRQCHVAYDGQAGTGNARSPLTADQVTAIRTRYAAGDVPHRVLAAEYGVTQATISNIVLGRRYREV